MHHHVHLKNFKCADEYFETLVIPCNLWCIGALLNFCGSSCDISQICLS